MIVLLVIVGEGRTKSELWRLLFRMQLLCRCERGCRCWRQRSWVVAGTVRRRTVSTGRSNAAACIYSPVLCLLSGVLDDTVVDPEHLVVWVPGSQALRDEVRPKDWCQSPAYVVTKGQTNSTGACEWDPVALGSESAAGDAVAEVDESRIDFQGFGWGGLWRC